MLNDPLANVLSGILNYDRVGKKLFTVHPASRVVRKVLQILNEQGYLGSTEVVTESRGGVVKVNLLGNINKCGVIKPRFSVTMGEYEKFEKRFLPAKGVGVLIVSTIKGMMTHEEAKSQNLGGRLIAYCY
ncbi:MAG: 30S ribosomal protein S8 [Candidatus Woesearchaeota archaeon]